MTEFEKWVKCENKNNADYIQDEVYYGAELAWKASRKETLEWVLKKAQEHYPDDWDAYDLIKDIQKELTPTQSQNQSSDKATNNSD